MPQEEPCDKTCDRHKTPGIHIGIPGVSYLAHRCMVSGPSRVSPMTAAICSRGISIAKSFFVIDMAALLAPLSHDVANFDCISVWNFLWLRQIAGFFIVVSASFTDVIIKFTNKVNKKNIKMVC